MSEDPVIRALEHVERHGDVAPGRRQDPATVTMRARIQRENLAAYDHEWGRFVLTSTGRQRIARRRNPPRLGEVAEFRPRALRQGQR